MSCRSQLASWQALNISADKMKEVHLKDLFANNSSRFELFSTQTPGILFDYSKQLIDEKVLNQLLKLADDCDVAAWRDKMFSGEKINFTE
ncbi:MAG: glucose-6-phosphate isomerase, partial [Pseudoalteromonas sp.]